MTDFGSTWEGEGEEAQQCNHYAQYRQWLYELHYKVEGNIEKLISESDNKENLEAIKILMRNIHDFVCEHEGDVKLLENIILLDAYIGNINAIEFKIEREHEFETDEDEK